MADLAKATPKMTHVDFARWVAWMGKECSNWAGEVLCCDPAELLSPMRENSVRRFFEAMEARIGHIGQTTGIWPARDAALRDVESVLSPVPDSMPDVDELLRVLDRVRKVLGDGR